MADDLNLEPEYGSAAAERAAEERLRQDPPAFPSLTLSPADADLSGPKALLAAKPAVSGQLAPL